MALRRIVPMVVLGLAMTFGAHRANAAITFQTVDLPDSVAGVDLMKYVYQVDGSFDAFHGFNLLFDPVRYADLTLITPLGADWDHVITQPDVGAPLDGVVSSMALTGLSNAAGTFEVGFTRLGAGIPGSQPVEFFDDNFNITSTSVTTAVVSSVPEPSTYVLMLTGLAVLARAVKRRRRTATPVAAA